MLGIYPVTPGLPLYAITTPSFDEIKIQLDPEYYPNQNLFIRSNSPERNAFIQSIHLDGRQFKGSFISHEQLIKSKELNFMLQQKPLK